MNKEQLLTIIQGGHLTDGDLADAILAELAAKAAGLTGEYRFDGYGEGCFVALDGSRFNPLTEDGKRWTACAECDRGGNGNAKDKCSCGWQCTKLNGLGCFLGTAIVGEPKAQPKLTRSQERYRRFLEYGDGFDSFLGFCRWDSAPERSWNCGA